MTQDLDHQLETAFADFRTALTPYVAAPGPADVRSTVKRRRRTTVAAVAACTALLVAVPAVGWAAFGRHPVPPPTDPAATTAAPSPAPSATPSATPQVSPSAATAPDGRITRAQLLAARFDLPDFPEINKARCDEDAQRVLPTPAGNQPGLLDLRYGDVDGDGAVETVATLGCRVYEFIEKQVVALDRDADGRIVALGRVAATHLDPAAAQDFSDVAAVRVTADGAVRVHVSEYRRCCAADYTKIPHQWRTFRWNGDRFLQSDGPTAFPSRTPNEEETTGAGTPSRGPDASAKFTVTATPLVYGKADANGRRPGNTTVTFVNTGRTAVEFPMITFPRNGQDQPLHTQWRGCIADGAKPDRHWCITEPIAAGARRSIVLPFQTESTAPGASLTVLVAASVDRAGTSTMGTVAKATISTSFSE